MIEKTEYSQIFLIICMIAMAVIVFFCLIRAIRGPRFTDRIMAGNMVSTDVLAFVCLLAVFLQEDFVIDVAVIYAILGFIATVVLSKIIVAREKKHRLRGDEPEIVDVSKEEDWK